MKKNLNIIGFIAALLLFSSIVMKINHLPGAGVAMALSGLSLSIYLPFFLLSGDLRGAAAVTGAISGALINLGITFKFQHWPGAGVMLVLGLSLFALAFIPLLLRHRLKEEARERNTIMNTCGAMGLTLFALGILFRIMHWPGAAIMLVASILFLFFGYFLLYMLDRKIDAQTKNTYLRKAFFTLIIGGILATFIVLDLGRPFLKRNEQVSSKVFLIPMNESRHSMMLP